MFFIKTTFNLRIYEDYTYNHKLNFLTKFNIINNLSQRNFNKISLNFGFKDIKFEKKKMILFFMVLELITNQKCILTSSKKNLIYLRIKKGSITGCKITLRKVNLYNFIDNLILSLPRSDVFKGFFYNQEKSKQQHFSTKLNELFIFHTLETEWQSYINSLEITFSFNTFSDYEKFFILSHNKIPLIII
jgi:large subunit ribosomal protein L5